jgi:hypothetical protein
VDIVISKTDLSRQKDLIVNFVFKNDAKSPREMFARLEYKKAIQKCTCWLSKADINKSQLTAVDGKHRRRCTRARRPGRRAHNHRSASDRADS